MDWLIKVLWLTVLIFPMEINAGLLDKKLDCIWEWSEWNTYGFGDRMRERVIYRYPANGGIACPVELKEVIKPAVPTLPTVAQVAEEVTTNFLNPVTRNRRRKRQQDRQTREVMTNKRDILFILDSSGSIGSGTFTTMKSDLAELIGLICPNEDPEGPFEYNKHRAAMLKYSYNVHTSFNFNAYRDTSAIQKAIIAESYIGGGTCTNKAFDNALGMFSKQNGSRPDVNHEVLIITDGQSNCGSPAASVKRLKDAGVKVFALAVGISSDSGRNEISSYVSEPIEEHLFALSDFRKLKELVNLVKSNIDSGTLKCAPLNTG